MCADFLMNMLMKSQVGSCFESPIELYTDKYIRTCKGEIIFSWWAQWLAASTQALCCLHERSSQQVQASMTAPVSPECSTEWFPKWTRNYFKLMDLKGSSFLIPSTSEIATLILRCQFSGCYHRKTLSHEHRTIFCELKRVAEHMDHVPAAQGLLAGQLKLWGQQSWNQVSGMAFGSWVLAVAKYGELGRCGHLWRWLHGEIRGVQVWAHLCILQNMSWVGHSNPCPWGAQLEHSWQGPCKAHCCITSKCLLTSASRLLGKAGSGAECAKLQCYPS